MESKPNTNWSTTAIVIGLCAAIGFGAVYAMVGSDDNRTERQVAEKSQQAKPSAASAGLTNTASANVSATSANEGAAATALLGGDGKPLNRGEMTTFVFKKKPMAFDKPPEFNGPDGERMKLTDLKGKVVLLNLWATWCAPCRKEMPFLDKLQRELGSDQFEVVALSVDRGSPGKSKKFLADVGATALKFYHDPDAKAGFSMMAIGMPTTLLFDREGREIGRLVGPAEWHSQEAKDLIKAAIAAG